MNKFEKSLVSVAALTGSFVGLGSTIDNGSVAEAAPIEQGIYDIPDECVKYNEGYGVSENAERALVAVGFTGIKVDGEISNPKEQGAVIGAQKFLKSIDVLDDAVPTCGYAGSITLKAVRLMQNPSSRADESQIDQTTTVETTSSGTNETCEDIRLTSWVESRLPGSDGDLVLDNGAEARALQEALNNKGFNVGNANGDVGPRTLGSFAVFQKETFGKVDCLLGSQSSSALDLRTSEKRVVAPTSRTNSRNNGIVDGCKAEYDVDYVVCADTGPGKETGYFYKRSSNGDQTLLREFEITSSQIDTDGPNSNKDTLTRKGHHIMGYASRRTPKLSLRNFLQFNGGQGIHYYPIVGDWADSSGCVRTDLDTSNYLFETVAVNSNAAFTGNVEVIIK